MCPDSIVLVLEVYCIADKPHGYKTDKFRNILKSKKVENK